MKAAAVQQACAYRRPLPKYCARLTDCTVRMRVRKPAPPTVEATVGGAIIGNVEL